MTVEKSLLNSGSEAIKNNDFLKDVLKQTLNLTFKLLLSSTDIQVASRLAAYKLTAAP